MKRPMWIILPIVFIANAAAQTFWAWGGSKFALVMLAVTCAFLAIILSVYARGWRDALDGWSRTTEGWGAAQTWGMKQTDIVRDLLNELHTYDEEAVEIHAGRSVTANLAYLKTFEEEDAKLVTEALVDDLRKRNE